MSAQEWNFNNLRTLHQLYIIAFAAKVIILILPSGILFGKFSNGKWSCKEFIVSFCRSLPWFWGNILKCKLFCIELLFIMLASLDINEYLFTVNFSVMKSLLLLPKLSLNWWIALHKYLEHMGSMVTYWRLSWHSSS